MSRHKGQYLDFTEVLLIIVLYNTDLNDSVTFKTLLKASVTLKTKKLSLFVYDNSAKPQDITPDLYLDWDIRYFHDPSNPGVSKAYNYGAEIAVRESKKWILLLDQDTYFPVNTFEEFAKVVDYPEIELFCPILKTDLAIVSPSVYKFKRGFAPKAMLPGVKSLTDFSPINSGIFISTKLFAASGGYNSDIRLDFSDFYFIGKVKRHVDKFMVLTIVCKHELSTSTVQPINNAIFRYKSYCDGAKKSVENLEDWITLFFICLLRSFKLTLTYKRLIFLSIFNRHYLR